MKTIFNTRTLLSLSILIGSLLLANQASAQFDTDTPTPIPTPRFNAEGTPIISTVWMEIDDGATPSPQPSPTPNPLDTVKVKEISSADESGDLGAYATPTPGHSYLSSKAVGSSTGSSQASGASSVGASSGSSGYGGGQAVGNGNLQASGTNAGNNSGYGTGGQAGGNTSGQGSSLGGESGLGSGSGMNGEQSGGGGSSAAKKQRMIDAYEAGIQYYKDKDFDNAIAYLKKCLTIKDRTIPRYYYAEANAMLGVIYKFFRPDAALSREYCEAALKIDPTTKTAKKLIHEIDVTGTENEKIYHRGVSLYQNGNFTQAVSLLSEMTETKDPSTPSFYYAEANRTLGIIYQYYLKDEQKALRYYQAGLKIEPADQLAQKNMAKLLKD